MLLKHNIHPHGCRAVNDYADAERDERYHGGGGGGGSANGATPGGGGETLSWGELEPISATLTPPKPFPLRALSPRLCALVSAACTAADVNGMQSIAYHCALVSVAMVAAADFKIQTLAPDFRPFSVYTAGVAPSGSRKDSVFNAFFGGHRRADAKVIEAHTEAKRARDEFYAKPAAERKDREPPPRVNRRAPRRAVSDATIEAWLSTLGGGSRYMSLVTPEAKAALGTWSFNKERAGATFSALNDLFTSGAYTSTRVGRGDVNVSGAAPSVCLLTQPGFGDDLLLGADTLGGFGARTLIARVDRENITKGWGVGSRDQTALDTLRDFYRLVVNIRERQDRGAHIYQRERTDARQVVELTDSAYERLQQKGAEIDSAAATDSALSSLTSRLERTPELVATLAAIETALEAYAAGYEHGSLSTDVDAIERAIVVMDWENSELERLAAVAAIEERSSVAQHIKERLEAIYAERNQGGDLHRDMNSAGEFKVRTFTTQNAIPAAWRTPSRAAEVITLLTDVGAIQEVRRGWFAVHPDITGAHNG